MRWIAGAKSNRRGLAAMLAIVAPLPPAALLAQPPAAVPPPAPTPPADCPPAAAAAAAQTREIRVGTCVRSTLGADDSTTADGVHYEDYRLTLRQDELVRIDMDAIPPPSTSPNDVPYGFDTYLELRRPGEETALRTNDDRADSLNSRILFTAPSAGEYIVRARALGAGTGDYALSVTAPPNEVRNIEVGGAPIRSTLADTDPQANERYYDEYRLRLTQGQVIQVDMEVAVPNPVGTGVFDPYLAVYQADEEQPLETNDDRGDSLNARLIFRVPATGLYRVRAQGYSRSTGEYSLAASRLAAMPRPAILAGDEAQGTFQDGSPASERYGASVRYAEYLFEGRQGERIQLDATSSLTPHLFFGGEDRVWLADTRGDETSARIIAVVRRTGPYFVRLEVPAPHLGTFRLQLTRRPDAPLGEPPVLDRSAPLEGHLGLDSGFIMREDESGLVDSFYRIYALPVQANETITIALDSSDFDPVLEAGAMSMLGFAVAAYNDDAAGLNSRLVLRPPATGTILLRARSLSGNVRHDGRFTLRVIRGLEPPPTP